MTFSLRRLRLGMGVAVSLVFLTACGTPLSFVLDSTGEEAADPDTDSGPPAVFESATPQVVVGDGFSCALARDGTVKCWGSNENNRLGFTRSDLYYAPVPMTLLDGEVQRASHSSATCARLTGGAVKC
jgi:hypothetical protein